MTTYDAPDSTNGSRRRPEDQRQDGAVQSDFIDGEVVAVEVHDDLTASQTMPTPGPGAVRRRAAETGEHPTVQPSGPDSAGLQDSLDQIERLAAELKEIAEVITPSPNSAGRQHSSGQQGSARHGGRQQPAGQQESARRGAPAGTSGQPGASAPARGSAVPPSSPPTAKVRPIVDGLRAGGVSTAATRAQPGGSRPGGPRFGAHNVPPSAAARPGTASGVASPVTPASAARPATPGSTERPGTPPAGGDEQIYAWLGPGSEQGDRPTSPLAVGTSVVQEPLPPEPKRKGNPDLVFGAEAATKPAATKPAATTPERPAAASATGSAKAEAATQPIKTSAGSKGTDPKTVAATAAAASNPAATASNAAAARTTAPQQATPAQQTARASKNARSTRADKVAVTTAMPTVFSAGSAKSSETTEALRTTAPPTRTAKKDQRRPAGRGKAPRGRYTAIVIGAFALAVPAFALGAVQPWNTSAKSEDKISVATGDRASTPPYTGEDPSAAVPNPSPSPSVASAAPITPREVTSGVAGDQPKERPAGPPKTVPPTHRKTAPVGLSLSVYAANVKPNEGESVRFKLTWKDGSGHFGGSGQQWGDGSPAGGSVDVKKCTGDAPASSGATEATHTFREAGTYTVRLSVTTYTCDGRTETQTVPMRVTVREAPSPTPTATPPSPTPSPTPTAKPED